MSWPETESREKIGGKGGKAMKEEVCFHRSSGKGDLSFNLSSLFWGFNWGRVSEKKK